MSESQVCGGVTQATRAVTNNIPQVKIMNIQVHPLVGILKSNQITLLPAVFLYLSQAMNARIGNIQVMTRLITVTALMAAFIGAVDILLSKGLSQLLR